MTCYQQDTESLMIRFLIVIIIFQMSSELKVYFSIMSMV